MLFTFKLTSDQKDAAQIFTAFKDTPYALFFDSSDTKHKDARYSYICLFPIETIEAKDGHITITGIEGAQNHTDDPFKTLQDRLSHWRTYFKYDDSQNLQDKSLPPFYGGAAGMLGYDLARNIENLPQHTENTENTPDMIIGIYTYVLAFDHKGNTADIYIHADTEQSATQKYNEIISAIDNAPILPPYNAARTPVTFTPLKSKEAYKADIQRVIDYIYEGDIFQANLSNRFEAITPDNFDTYAHYLSLRDINPAPFACFMHINDNLQIASSSPERFLHIEDKIVTTRPIKGTCKRSKKQNEDKELAIKLKNNIKDRAENTMIVDLLRNDLSKTCRAESINVPQLCVLESFSGVHHLVSTVQGTLKVPYVAIDTIRACFPGGSITGAPKIRAMEIIEELEPKRRGPYCGSMAWFGLNGDMDSNILIRTLVYKGNKASLCAGGGITAQSNPQSEHQETLDKAARIFESFRGKPHPANKINPAYQT